MVLVLLAWIASLLTDPRVRVRRSGLEGPLAVITISVFGSIVVNPSGVAGVPAEVTKAAMFFLSFVLFFYFMVSVVRDWDDVDRIVRLLVLGGAIVAGSALVEYRTSFSVFNLLGHLPFLQPLDLPIEDPRGGRPRPYGSAEHPIALSAFLVILLPLVIYLVRRHGRVWWLAAAFILMGMVSTVSRTGVVMLAVALISLLFMRPRQVWRWLPLLIPLVIATKLLVPGAIGSLRYQFNPTGGDHREPEHVSRQHPGGQPANRHRSGVPGRGAKAGVGNRLRRPGARQHGEDRTGARRPVARHAVRHGFRRPPRVGLARGALLSPGRAQRAR